MQGTEAGFLYAGYSSRLSVYRVQKQVFCMQGTVAGFQYAGYSSRLSVYRVQKHGFCFSFQIFSPPFFPNFVTICTPICSNHPYCYGYTAKAQSLTGLGGSRY